MTDDTLSTIDAAVKARVSVRQLDLWTKRGYLHPLWADGPGRAYTAKRWTPGDVERAEMLGVFARTICAPDGFAAVAHALDNAPRFAMTDGDYAVFIELRAVTDDPPESDLPSMHRYFADKAKGRA